jgi:MYXO-CTERM domain-containing protein
MRRTLTLLMPALLAASAAEAQVVISEVQPNPIGSDDAEWVELQNLGSAPVDLGGWRLNDFGPNPPREYAFPAGTSLAADQVVVVAKDAAAYRTMAMMANLAQLEPDFELLEANDPTDDPMVPNLTVALSGGGAWALANTGDGVRLADASRTPVSEAEYGSGRAEIAGNPVSPAPGEGASIVRVAASGDSAAAFMVTAMPTPGIGFGQSPPAPPSISGVTRQPAIWSFGDTVGVSSTVADPDGVGSVEVYVATATSTTGPAAGAYVPLAASASGASYGIFGQVQGLSAALSFTEPTSFNQRYLRYFVFAVDNGGAATQQPSNATPDAASPGFFWENVLPAQAVFPIGAVRAQGASEVPTWQHHSVRIEGVATTRGEAFVAGATNFFVSDPTSLDAIRVFDDVLNPVAVNPGDRVRVTGKVGVFRGVRQVGRDERTGGAVADGAEITIEVLGTATVPLRVVTPTALVAAAEAHESQLVELENVRLVNDPANNQPPPATFAANTSVYVSDGATVLTVRIVGTTDLVGVATPAGAFTLRGIWTQFSNNGLGGYQLQPRGAADMPTGGGPIDAGVLDAGALDAGAIDGGSAIDGGRQADATAPDAAESDAAAADAGSAPGDGGDVLPPDAGLSQDAGPSADASVAPDASLADAGPRRDSGIFGREEKDEGCGCSSVPGRDGGDAPATGLALLALGALVGRRRRR